MWIDSTRPVSRRGLLPQVAATAGNDALYHAMSAAGLIAPVPAYTGPPVLPPGSGAGTRVIILGAGIAGLVAAYELSRAGYACVVLEARERAGGRVETIRGGDVVRELDSEQVCTFDREEHLYLNTGAARIPYHHRAVLGYCKAFGVALEPIIQVNRAALFRSADAFGGVPQVSRVLHTDTRGFVAELLARAIQARALDPALEDQALDAEDRERMLQLLRELGDLDERYRYRGSPRAGYEDQRNEGLVPGTVHIPVALSELLRFDLWRRRMSYHETLNHQPTMLQPVGGMDAIPRAFVQRVGHLIQYRAVVTQIRKTERGVRIVYRPAGDGAERSVEGAYCICTIPAPVLVDIDSDLAPAYKQTLASMRYSRAAKLGFQARRFWEVEQFIYGGISWTDEDINQIWYPTAGIHRDQGVLLGAYIWDREDATRFARMSPQARLVMARAQGQRLHPGYGREVSKGVSRSWYKTEFQRGSWYENDGNAPPAVLRQPDGAIYFAGEHMSALTGWQEGAVLSAHATIRAISERVLRG